MSKLDIKTSWDLSPLLSGDNDPKIADYRKQTSEATDAFVKNWRERDDYLHDPKILREALDELKAWEEMPGNANEVVYFHLRSEVESDNATVKAKYGQAMEFYQSVIVKMQFFNLKLGRINPNDQKKLIDAPELKPFRHYLVRIFESAKHRLSEPEERILTLKSTVARDKWMQMTNDLLAKLQQETINAQGKKQKLGLEGLIGLFESENQDVRDQAAAAFNRLLLETSFTAEAEINAVLLNKKIDDELRGYDRPDQARHISDDIPTIAVDKLVEAVSGRFEISKRYYQLKAKLMGKDKLAYHERNIPYGEANQDLKYADAVELVTDIFTGIDPQFAEIFTSAVENGRVDVYPKQGKRGGAFCTIDGKQHPVLVLLNYNNKLSDIRTIAHEFGHAINHELSRKQNSLNFDIGLATAEVASTFMESFASARLIRDANEELAFGLMLGELGDLVSTVFRQTAFYNFETDLHREFRKNGHLTYQDIGKIFQRHMISYMGDAVEQSPGSENWWIYVMHFRVMFYVYSYTSGSLISRALAAKVRQDPKFIDQVKQFLSSGTSKSPDEVFLSMGINITDSGFWSEGIDEIEALLDRTEKLAKKLGKIN